VKIFTSLPQVAFQKCLFLVPNPLRSCALLPHPHPLPHLLYLPYYVFYWAYWYVGARVFGAIVAKAPLRYTGTMRRNGTGWRLHCNCHCNSGTAMICNTGDWIIRHSLHITRGFVLNCKFFLRISFFKKKNLVRIGLNRKWLNWKNQEVMKHIRQRFS
jgi:hypothetical protein